jgi:hypothetical protein
LFKAKGAKEQKRKENYLFSLKVLKKFTQSRKEAKTQRKK